ncbi:MAG: fibronectin type III domain-containing protein, partial [Actinomycetes bacterium]
WAAPTNNGGSPIVTYRIAVSPSLGGADETSTTASKTITGLTNGTQYTFTVFATNEAGLESLAASVVATPVGAGNPAIGLITPNYAKAGAGGGGNTIVLDGTDLDGIDDLAGP